MDEEKEEDIILTKEEVMNVIEFARAYSNGYNSSYLTPELVNARMKDVTLNPMLPNQEILDRAMLDPKTHERDLQAFSQNFELSSMIYKRLLSYLGNMLSFDYTYTSSANRNDYNTLKYKKDVSILDNFLDKFDYKTELTVAVKEMLRNDAYFAVVVDTGEKIVLQELPAEYCKVTGRWSGGLLFSFNMYWFLQPGVDVELYPKFFKKKRDELWGNMKETLQYNPHINPYERDKSQWIYWVDIPVNLGVVFKLTPELATRLPYFSPLFNDLILQSLMRNLQKNINMAAASKIIIGQVPMLNKDAKSTVKDSIAVSPDLLGKFLGLVKSAIGDAVKIASAPLSEIKGVEFNPENGLYDSYLRTALASSGINTNLIFSSTVKPNAIETQLSLNVDEQMMSSLYRQFENFINHQINLRTKNFKFKLIFEGTEFFLNREARIKRAMDLFNQGIVLPQKIAASLGMKPKDFVKQLEEGGETSFMNLLTPPSLHIEEMRAKFLAENPKLQTLKLPENNTSSEKQTNPNNKGGRPEKNISEISEAGMKSREDAVTETRK